MLEDFISIHDLSLYEFHEILDTAQAIKERPLRFQNKLKNKISALIFEKPSPWIRVTFEVALIELGGQAIFLGPPDIQDKAKAGIEDMGQYLEKWLDAVIIHTANHQAVIDLAQGCAVPIINACTSLLHPCQALADFLTLREKKGDLAQLYLAYIGLGSNICHSLLLAAAKAGSTIAVASPPGFEPQPEVVQQAKQDALTSGAHLYFTQNPEEAVAEADVIYTDIRTSLNYQAGTAKIYQTFAPFQVSQKLMAKAKKEALFMHGQPWQHGQEVAEEIINSDLSLVVEQSENRLHVQKAIMLLLLRKKK